MDTIALDDALAELKAAGNERMRAQNRKNGAGENQFGVRLGDIRKVKTKIKADHELAIAFWNTEIIEARLLATLILKPRQIAPAELDRMVRAVDFVQVADWLAAYVVKKHPERESLRLAWMEDPDPWAARAGWSLTAQRIDKDPAGLDLPALLDRIDAEMGQADPRVQWTMNFCLAGIGINFPELRARAIDIGEKLGIFRDYPVPRGCTSPFAPIWIAEIARRQDSPG